jgi:hypothetical protein
VETKTCNKCDTKTPLELMVKGENICKACRKLYNLEWRKNNVDYHKNDYAINKNRI